METLSLTYSQWDNFKHQAYAVVGDSFYELQTTTGLDKIWVLLPQTYTGDAETLEEE